MVECFADHMANDGGLRRLGDGQFHDKPTVPEHRHCGGDLRQLLQTMGDVQNRDTLGSELSQHVEQTRDVVAGERRCRLVQNKHLRVG